MKTLAHFNLINPPPVPKYAPGDRIGNLRVLEIGGHEMRGLSKKMWWYLVVCDCGSAPFQINQQNLRKRHQCAECTRDRKARPRDKTAATDGDVVDFARLRW